MIDDNKIKGYNQYFAAAVLEERGVINESITINPQALCKMQNCKTKRRTLRDL